MVFAAHHSRYRVGLAVVGLATLVTLGGCGQDKTGQGTTTASVAEPSTTPTESPEMSPEQSPGKSTETSTDKPHSHTDTGVIFDEGGVLKLCGEVLESYPPQCGGDPIDLVNPDGVDLGAFDTANGVRWSEDFVEVTWSEGKNGELIIEAANPAP